MTTWAIEDQPVASQARYWQLRAERAEAQLKAERKRKEPETLAEVGQELKQARETAAHFREEARVWKEVSSKAYARIDELESEGAASVLKRERDQWRASWRTCTRRLADKIEHLGLEHSGTEPNGDAT